MNPVNLSLLLSPKKRFKIQDKRGRAIFFEPNTVQKRILKYIIRCWQAKKPVKIIIIKGRQQGITTLFTLIGESAALKVPGFKVFMVTHDSALAKDLFENKIKFAWDQLPVPFKSLYTLHRNNVRQLLFDDQMLKSSITVGTSARGGTFQMIHISEPGMLSTSKKNWQELITGTLPAGEFADMIVWESTADGGLGEFYKLVKENQKPNSEYRVMFLSWTDSEEYQKEVPQDISWLKEYDLLSRDYKLEPDPVKKHGITKEQFYWYYTKAKLLREEVKVQYPFTIDEAFISLAKNYFNLRLVIDAQEKARKVPYTMWNDWKIYKQPTNHVYAVGGDIATGESNDNSSLHVYDAETGEQVAVATGKYDEPTAARMMIEIGYYYNTAYLAPEINNMGRAVMYFLIQYGYPEDKLFKRIGEDPTKQRENRLGNYGWLTSSVTRPVLLADFRNSFEDGTLKINDPETLAEMMVFVNNNGKYQAQEGSNDDRVIGAMIGWQIIQYIVKFG